MTAKTDIFQMTANTRFILAKLREAAVGDLITYQTLANAAGFHVDGSTASLATARHILLRDEHMVFGVVRGVGLKRLNDREIVGTSAGFANKMRRTARRGMKTVSAVADFSALPREDQMRHSAAMSTFAVIAHIATDRALTHVEQAAPPTREGLPISKTLSLFEGEKRERREKSNDDV